MNKTAKIIVWLVVIILAIWGFSNLNKKAPVVPVSGEPVKIGVILPLTGNGSDQGEWVKKGLDLALEEINQNSPYQLQLVYEDSHGDPKTAVSIYTDLSGRLKMPAIVTWGSGVGIALTPLVNKDQVIQMGVATAATTYSTPDDFTFRTFPSSDLEAKFLAGIVMNELKTKKLAILKLNNDYGQSSAASFKKFFEELGGVVTMEETIQPDTTDFRTQLAKLKNKTDDSLIYLATYPKEGALLLRQARELGLTSRFVASVAILGGKDFFSLAGNAADGLLVVTSMPGTDEDLSGALRRFIGGYRKKYGEEEGPQSLYAARAYDGLHLIAKVLKDCHDNSNPVCLQNKLFGIKNYPGASGEITFDQNGDISSQFYLLQIKDGKFVKLEQ